MLFENYSFNCPGSLLAAARQSVADGLLAATDSGIAEPCLLWLDRLAASRSDWLGAVGQVLDSLGRTAEGAPGTESARSAVVDWFQHARTAAALAHVSRKLHDQVGDLPSFTLRAYDPQATPVLLSGSLSRLEDLAQRYRQPAQGILFARPRRELVTLANVEDLVREAKVACRIGDSRIGGALDGCYALDWLRQRGYFVPWMRAATPAVLTALLHDPREPQPQAVMQFAWRAGDKTALAPTVATWLAANPQWETQPATFAGAAANDNLADVARAVLAKADEEKATGPD